jgi:hypothetical protein
MTLAEIGERLGLTREQVRMNEVQGLRRLEALGDLALGERGAEPEERDVPKDTTEPDEPADSD